VLGLRLATLCVFFVAGCYIERQYTIDPRIVPVIESLPPESTRISQHRRSVGEVEVALGCRAAGGGEVAPIYEGVVHGPLGDWRFKAPGPTVRTRDCDSPDALDEAAEYFAIAYRKLHGAVPVARPDGTPTYVRQSALLLETRSPATGGRLAIRARVFNFLSIFAPMFGGIGSVDVVAGALLAIRAGDDCASHAVGCATNGPLERGFGFALPIIGALSLVATAALLAGNARDAMIEISRGRPDWLYYSVPSE
jgi:hypothetical protein